MMAKGCDKKCEYCVWLNVGTHTSDKCSRKTSCFICGCTSHATKDHEFSDIERGNMILETDTCRKCKTHHSGYGGMCIDGKDHVHPTSVNRVDVRAYLQYIGYSVQ